ncbi:hypothetical protein HPP92_027666 [Vanilla planifolia]|uniref:Uncharacterized protein n=1 Tax=Vanilla planifolia TaxID=51239 RepID=A0A835U413_VANPL|nr:hypothetical protein HPP92_027666 [Vanilla planifolia]
MAVILKNKRDRQLLLGIAWKKYEDMGIAIKADLFEDLSDCRSSRGLAERDSSYVAAAVVVTSWKSFVATTVCPVGEDRLGPCLWSTTE